MEKKFKLEVEIEESKAKELLNAIFGKSDFEFELQKRLTAYRHVVSILARYEQINGQIKCRDDAEFRAIFNATESAEQAIIDHVMTEIRKLGGQ